MAYSVSRENALLSHNKGGEMENVANFRWPFVGQGITDFSASKLIRRAGIPSTTLLLRDLKKS